MSFSYSQIEQLWIQYGGAASAAPMAAAIAMAESGGDPNAINTANSNGTTDRGLFQINSIWGSMSSTDLATNVRAAISISKNGSNWGPWSTFNNGAFRRFLSPGTAPSGGIISGATTGSPLGTPAALAPAVPISSNDPTAMTVATGAGSTCAFALGTKFKVLIFSQNFSICIISKHEARALIGAFTIAGGAVITLVGVAVVLQYALDKSGLMTTVRSAANGPIIGTAMKVIK